MNVKARAKWSKKHRHHRHHHHTPSPTTLPPTRAPTPLPTRAPTPLPLTTTIGGSACNGWFKQRSSTTGCLGADDAEVQGYSCGNLGTLAECKWYVQSAGDAAFGMMYKSDDGQCRVLGLKDDLAEVSGDFATTCTALAAFATATSITAIADCNWRSSSGCHWSCYEIKCQDGSWADGGR